MAVAVVEFLTAQHKMVDQAAVALTVLQVVQALLEEITAELVRHHRVDFLQVAEAVEQVQSAQLQLS
jgi:hypothetical protein